MKNLLSLLLPLALLLSLTACGEKSADEFKTVREDLQLVDIDDEIEKSSKINPKYDTKRRI